MIPRIIHQTWKSAEVPEPLGTYQAKWRRLHPGFEYRLWTDADNDALVADNFPELAELYRSLERGILRADLARCLYLAKYGGLYVDLDVEPLKPFDSFLETHGDCLLGSEPTVHARQLWGQQRLACNAAMASAPGHPFWSRMIEEIKRRVALGTSKNPVWLTGPQALDATYNRCGAELGVTLCEPDVFFPLPDLHSYQLRLSAAHKRHYQHMLALGSYPSSSMAVHHWAHTWISGQKTKRIIRGLLARGGEGKAVALGRKTVDELLRPQRYGVAFVESAFPPRPEREQAYREGVARGREVAGRSSLALLILLRDRIDLALLLRARIERLAPAFRELRVLVLCGDSVDGTDEIMADWQRAAPDRVRLVSPPPLPSGLGTFARLARLRNTLLEAAQADAVDFVALLDGDLEGPVSLEGLMHSVGLMAQPQGPDGVAAFGINNWFGLPQVLPFFGYSYYDPLAFRRDGFERRGSDASVRMGLRNLRRGDAPLAVKSAFAGFAVYRSDRLAGLRYDPEADDCEHVSLHRALAARGGRLVLNPSLLLLAGRQGHHVDQQ